MQLRQLRYLIAVAEHGNFTRAAEALHVSQPALSQRIMQIEDRLGVALLDRSGRTVTVTDAGQAYIAHARRALNELDLGERAIHDVRDLSRGEVRLATTPTFTAYLVGPLVAAFHARYPGISVKIREMSLDTIEAAVAADEVDLGIAFKLERAPDLEYQPLFVEKLSMVVASRHPLAQQSAAVGMSVLEQTTFCLLSTNFATRSQIDSYLRQQHIVPKVVIEANTIGALLEIVRRSELATILPEAICAQLPGLCNLPLCPPMPPRTVMLLRRRDSYLSAAAQAFAALGAEHVSQLAGGEPALGS